MLQKIWPYSKILLVTQEKKPNEEKTPPEQERTYYQITQTDKKSANSYR